MKPLRIAHVVPCYLPAVEYGGTVRCVATLAKAQADLGLEITVHTTNARGMASTTPEAPGWKDVNGVPVCYAEAMWPRSFFLAPKLVIDLAHTLSRGVDLVHLHGLWVFSTAAGSRLCEVRGVPFVVTPHGALSRWALAHKSLKKSVYFRLIERSTLNHAAFIHFATQTEQAEAPSIGSEVVIPNPIPLDDFLSVAPLTSRRPLRLIVVGRVHPVKGFDLLLPALARARARGCDCRLTVAGPDEAGYLATVKALVLEHGLGAMVDFTGRLEPRELPAALAEASALVMASHQESFGMAAAEAMAAARPVIVSSRVSIADDVARAACGLVSDHDVASLAACIEQLYERADELPAMGARGRVYAREHFSPDRVAKATVRAYEDVIEAKHATG
ncbi:MAG: glycosyltransferase [Myxococcota bacterium]